MSKAPVVSPAKVNVFFSQVSADEIVYDCDICLPLSSSCTSIIYVPVLFDLTQNDNVKLSADDVPFFKYCKFWPSILWLKNTLSPAAGEASAVVQSHFKDFAKPWPVGTVVDCDCVQVPCEVITDANLST